MSNSEQVSRERKKEEALLRMKKIGIFPGTIKQFEKSDLVSQSLPPVGACFWIEGEQLERVREFEKKYNALVYFVIHSYTIIGEMESYLYVSDYEEEWEMDRAYLGNGKALVYVYNLDAPDCSEFGSISFALTSAAGLRRTW